METRLYSPRRLCTIARSWNNCQISHRSTCPILTLSLGNPSGSPWGRECVPADFLAVLELADLPGFFPWSPGLSRAGAVYVARESASKLRVGTFKSDLSPSTKEM